MKNTPTTREVQNARISAKTITKLENRQGSNTKSCWSSITTASFMNGESCFTVQFLRLGEEEEEEG